MLWHKIWLLGSVAVLTGLGLYFIFPSPAGYIMGIPYGHSLGLADLLNLIIDVVVGIFGNEWRRNSLVERGFDNVSDEIAATADGATGEYLRNPDKIPFLDSPQKRSEPHF